jgi:Caspase domain
MRGSRAALLAALFGLILSGCAGTPEPATPPPRAERPIYELGEKWIRNDGIYELTRIEDDRYVFSSSGEREIHLSRSLVVWQVTGRPSIAQRRTIEFQNPPTLQWPLRIGQKDRRPGVVYNGGSRLGGTATPETTLTVDRYEEVRVPAGTFNAFRITGDIQGQINRLGGYVFRAWYAPEARQLVKADSFDLPALNFEVVALEPRDAVGRTPLQVTLEEPADQARLTTDKLQVVGKVTGGQGITQVIVTLNAIEVARVDERDQPKPILRLNLAVALRAGQNVLLVTATDAAGETQQAARTVYYDAAPTQAAAGSRWAALRGALAALAAGTRVTQTPPPGAFQLTLSTPSDQAHVDQDAIALAGLIASATGVTRVLVTLNGRETARIEEPAPVRSLPLNVPLSLREGPNTIVVTATEADGLHHQEVRTVHYEPRAPLALTIRYPEDQARLADENTVLAAILTAGRGIARVSVVVNGTEVHQQTERTPQRSLALAVPLVVRPGANTIVLSATDADGTVRQEIRTVMLDRARGAAVAAPPPPAPRPQPERWAVVVGVGQYEDPGIPRLRYTVPDADAVYQLLTGPGGFPRDHVLLLTDRAERKPTLRNLKWALGTFLSRSAKKDDTVVIFFAGHGAPEIDPRGLERDGIAKYLVPLDADLDDLYGTALPMDELQTIFNRIEAERIVVLLDACYSGGAGGRTFLAKRTRATALDDLFLERLTRAKGRAIITAARPTELSLELPELGHGLFTYYVLDGLGGAADANHDGIVSLQELYEYVEHQVAEKSRAAGANQHPVLKGELEGALPLIKVGR